MSSAPAVPAPKRPSAERVRLAVSSVWPDAYGAALLGAAAIVNLVMSDGYERLTIARLVPDFAADIYVVLLIVSCVAIIFGVSTRKAVVASRGAVILSLALAFNGLAIFVEFGDNAAISMAAYMTAALLVMNRSFVLSRRLLVPWWLAEGPPPRNLR